MPQPRGASAPQGSLTHFLSSSRNLHTRARRQRPTEAPGDVPAEVRTSLTRSRGEDTGHSFGQQPSLQSRVMA